MKKLSALVFIVCICGCDSSTTSGEPLFESVGGINAITFVADEAILKSAFSDTLKASLGSEVVGVAIAEPMYDVSELNSRAFEGFARRSRNIILAEKTDKNYFSIDKNRFAKPQVFISLQGKTEKALDSIFKTHFSEITDSINSGEEREKLRRIRLSPNKEKGLRETLGIDLTMPSVFSIGKPLGGNFFWASRTIKNGRLSMLIYEIPMSALNDSDERLLEISAQKIRDSVGKLYVPGPKPTMHFSAVKEAPYSIKELTIAGKKAYELRGLWEVTNYTMGGPSVCYFIQDRERRRYIVLDGFVFAPGETKRPHLFEIQAIAKSIKF